MVFRLLSVVAGLTLAFAANAQGSPAEGVDYIELKPPQSTESSGKVEVIEFSGTAVRTAIRWNPISSPG
jgi:hypothetical protein